MWWRTTETHRATLPSNEISALDQMPISFTMEIGVFINNSERQNLISSELEELFRSNDIFDAKIVSVSVNSERIQNLKTPARLEQILLKNYELKPGNLLIAEWKNLEDAVLVTSERTLFISSEATSIQIYQVIRSWIVRDYKIRSILGRVKTFDGKELRHTYPPPSPEYEVLISVLNPRPDLQTLNWNVKRATEVYLQPFFNEFSNLSDFKLKSQWIYQVELKYGSKQIKDDTKLGRHFALDYEALPHIITSIERKLGTDVANKPCIHLVVYAPPCPTAPVYIYRNNQRVSNFSYESFISAKWGGIVIANPSHSTCSNNEDSTKPVEINLISHEVMDFVLYELRKIFELEIETPISDAAIVTLEQITPRLWEKDMYLRNGAIHLIASASSTLQSLVKLLNGIENIVISDLVAAEIHEAYENTLKAKHFLQQNNIQEAVNHARVAYIAAEKAFNDPSLLELLYFPQEQKYAIYIPLYLPIMIPVIFSLNAIKKFFKKEKEQGADTQSTEDKAKVDANIPNNN